MALTKNTFDYHKTIRAYIVLGFFLLVLIYCMVSNTEGKYDEQIVFCLGVLIGQVTTLVNFDFQKKDDQDKEEEDTKQ